jgi:hypothetical protein
VSFRFSQAHSGDVDDTPNQWGQINHQPKTCAASCPRIVARPARPACDLEPARQRVLKFQAPISDAATELS